MQYVKHGSCCHPETMRVAALGDLHCAKTAQGLFQPLFARVSEAADALLLAGHSLTDYGLPDEARISPAS